MKTERGYRFTIQFADMTPEHKAVGEFLEGLRNKKAEYIVRAVSFYMQYGNGGSICSASFRPDHAMRDSVSADAALMSASSCTNGVVASESVVSCGNAVPSSQLDAMLSSLEVW